MKKSVLIAAIFAIALSACCEENKPVSKGGQFVPPAQEQKADKPVDKGCDDTPKMTNDQIISETKKCESNGLTAQAFHCGTDPSTIQIQCEPKPAQ